MGKTIVLTAHEMPLVERACDRIMLLNNGKKILEGSPISLFEKVGWRYKVVIKGKIYEGNEKRERKTLYITNLGEIAQYFNNSNLYEIEIEPISLEDLYMKAIEGDEK